MKKTLTVLIIALCTAFLFSSCEERPVKRDKSKNTAPVIEDITEETAETNETEEIQVEEATVYPDDYVFSGEEINDELISEKLIGYWEFDDFGYSGGYNFFESGFLQLVLEYEVNQTGIYMVRNSGIYFSLDSKTWDEDVLIVRSVSNDEIVGTFGENILTLHRSDPSLIKENSGYYGEETDSSSTIIDAATEIGQGVSAK